MDKIYAILIGSSVLKDKTDRTAYTAKLSALFGALRIKYNYSGSSQFAHCRCPFTFSWQPSMGSMGSLTKPASTTFGMTLPWPLLSLITSRTYHIPSLHFRRQPSKRVTVTALETRSCARFSVCVAPRLMEAMGVVWTSTDSVSVFVF